MRFDIAQLCDVDIEVIDGDRGKNYPHQDELHDLGYCLFLSAKNVTQNGFLFGDNQFITQEKDELLNNGKLIRGDIVITTRGTVGNVAIYSADVPFDNIRINSGMLIIRCGNNIDNYYLYQVLRSKWFYNQIISIQSGSAQPQLPKSHFLKMSIPMPDMETQQKIAVILSRIGDKIAVNTAINENLEQQLHLMFVQMFSDSDKNVLLGDVIKTTSGGTPSRKHNEYYTNGTICWVKSKELVGSYIHDTEEYINNLAVSKSSAKLIPSHSVLIAMYGATVGAYGITAKAMTCNQAVCALLENKDYPFTYLYQIAYEQKQTLINLAVGSAQQNISQVLIKQLSIHSNTDIIKDFDTFARPLHNRIELLEAENKNLAALRDTLLPKLMSGEIDVSQVKI